MSAIIDTDSTVTTTAPEFSFLREIPAIDKEKPIWHCTGAYLEKHAPDRYAAVVEALCEPGVSIRSICRAYRVSDHTVKAVEARECENLAALKKSRIGTGQHLKRLAMDRMVELVPTGNLKDVGIVYGIVTEKIELESGHATQRIESIDGGRELHRKFAELTESMIKLADAREIPADIGLPGENGAAKARLLGPGDRAPIEVESDSQSDDSSSISEGPSSSPAKVNAISAVESALPRAADVGAGGVHSAESPPSNSNP